MTESEAVDLIRPGVLHHAGIWADVGAGTGMFTQSLRQLLVSGVIYAVDKTPHVLWSLAGGAPVSVVVVEADFTGPMEIPPCDGIIMANALHYASDPVATLHNVMGYLRPGGVLLLVEYETEQARPPWIPYPLPFRRLAEIARAADLAEPVELHRIPAGYGHQHIYSAMISKA